jgi:CBS domain-containing protein
MLCRDIMKSPVKTLSTQARIAEAAILMRDERIGFVPLCDETGKVVGTLTDRDIAVRVVAERESLDQPIERFMTPDVVSCQPDDEVGIAQDLMSDLQVSRIVCLNDHGGLEGVISLSDIAQLGQSADASTTLQSVSAREVHT